MFRFDGYVSDCLPMLEGKAELTELTKLRSN